MNNPLNMLLKMGNSPQAIMQAIQNNPQMKGVLEQVKVANNQMQQNNMSCQQYVQQYCRQNNIDLNQLIQVMSNFGIKM